MGRAVVGRGSRDCEGIVRGLRCIPRGWRRLQVHIILRGRPGGGPEASGKAIG